MILTASFSFTKKKTASFNLKKEKNSNIHFETFARLAWMLYNHFGGRNGKDGSQLRIKTGVKEIIKGESGAGKSKTHEGRT